MHEKETHHSCLMRIENSITQNNCWSSLFVISVGHLCWSSFSKTHNAEVTLLMEFSIHISQLP